MVKNSILNLIFVLFFTSCFGQIDGFYIGVDAGVSVLKSQFHYKFEDNQPELLNGLGYSNAVGPHARFTLGYTKNTHNLELAIQNIQIKTGFGFYYSNIGEGYSTQTLKGGVYTSLSYLFEPVRIGKFYFNFGPHLGLVIAGNSDFASGPTQSISETFDEQMNLIHTLRIQREEQRIHQAFINFGGRANLAYVLSDKFEINFNVAGLFTPYDVRGQKFNYQVDNTPIRYAQSNSNILTWTYGIGLKYHLNW